MCVKISVYTICDRLYQKEEHREKKCISIL